MIPKYLFSLLLLLGLLVSGCQSDVQPESTASAGDPTSMITPADPAESETIPAPTTTAITNEPLAALVNGKAITLAEYQSELQRFQAAAPDPELYPESVVLEELIDQVLLAQGADQAGFQVDAALVEARLEQLGLTTAELETWMADNFYNAESLRQALQRAIAAAWMREQISVQVPGTSEQIHARQILLYNADEADAVYNQLQAGTDFVTLVEEYEPVTKGELGWFPRGYLTVPELDAVIFDLQPGEYSPVITTVLGYHIVQVIEKDPQRALAPEARQILQQKAVQDWLVERREQSEIERFVP
ncbi:MAG: peptidylprolyl isomerase [Anaerolineales bacterium]|nr:peptidylprolyl isomerase [Anaerolineales bacterium]